jgi:hypothetical protein
MKRLFLFIVVLMLVPSFVLAQTLPPIPPGEDKIEVIFEGEKAPYTGQLFDQTTALRWGIWLQRYPMLLKEQTENQQKLCDTELTYQRSLIDISSSRRDAIEADLRARLAESEKQRFQLQQAEANQAFYQSKTFMFFLGFVTAGTSVWLSTRINK